MFHDAIPSFATWPINLKLSNVENNLNASSLYLQNIHYVLLFYNQTTSKRSQNQTTSERPPRTRPQVRDPRTRPQMRDPKTRCWCPYPVRYATSPHGVNVGITLFNFVSEWILHSNSNKVLQNGLHVVVSLAFRWNTCSEIFQIYADNNWFWQ